MRLHTVSTGEPLKLAKMEMIMKKKNSKSPRRPIIALVDDSLYIRAGLSDALKEKNVRVKTFWSAEELLVALRSQEFDIIVMDYTLTDGTNGAEYTRFLMSLRPERVIIGMSTNDFKQEFLGAGARGFIRKDGTPRQLAAKIIKFLKKK